MVQQCDLAVALQFISYLKRIAQTIITIYNFLLFAGQKVPYIPSLCTKNYLHQNSQTYSMSPEITRLLITNFTIVGAYPTLITFYCISVVLYLHVCRISRSARSALQPISIFHSSTNQRWLVLTSPSSMNNTTFVLSSHVSVILDECETKTFESIK